MAKYFSQEGLTYHQEKLTGLQKQAQTTGQQIGEEAGMNCDWHDNFGFEEARRQFELDSQRVTELSRTIAEGQIIETIEQNIRTSIGNTIKILEDDTVEREVTIGAWGESDPQNGLVSYESPLGKALIGAEVGDIKTMNIGGKTRIIEILEIFPPSYKYKGLIKILFKKTNS